MENKVILAYSIFNTSFGLCGIVLSKKGIARLILPGMTEDEIMSAISPSTSSGQALQSSALIKGSFKDTEDSIRRYFEGEKVVFDFPLDLSYITKFQRSVYKITKTIPYGEVKTYKWVAKKIDLPHAYRAVGGALSSNPIPLLIPCHRVVREDGGMGGFTAPGGVDLKIRMLKMENVKIYH